MAGLSRWLDRSEERLFPAAVFLATAAGVLAVRGVHHAAHDGAFSTTAQLAAATALGGAAYAAASGLRPPGLRA